MQINKFFILIFSLIVSSSAHTMEKENLFGWLGKLEKSNKNTQPTVHPVCQQLKKIEFNASDKEYYNLAQNMKKNNKTVCDCVKELLSAKKFQIAQTIDPNWKLDEKPFKTSLCLVKCDKNIVPEQCATIKQVFENPKTDPRKVDTIAIVKAKYDQNLESLAGMLLKKLVTIDNQNLATATLYLKKTHGIDTWALAHEKIHLEQLHSFELSKLLNKVNSKEYQYKYAKFQRVMEKEADLLPVACSQNWKENLSEKHQQNYLKLLPNFNEKVYEMCTYNNNLDIEKKTNCKNLFKAINALSKGVFDPKHPGLASRHLGQIKLRRLMEEQDKLRNNKQ